MLTKASIRRPVRYLGGLFIGATLAACGIDSPPYDELPLRDALRAAPEVLAEMPEQARHELALRLEEAHSSAADDTSVPSPEIPTLQSLIRNADEARDNAELDAVVLGDLARESEGFVLHALALGETPEHPALVPSLEGNPDDATLTLEQSALEGRAGAIVSVMAERAHAHAIVRTTGLPMGVITLGDTVYVNASWLVALSSLEPHSTVTPPAPIPAGGIKSPSPPSLTPQFTNPNPYNLPDSVSACATDVLGLCTCASTATCNHSPTDKTFADAQAECSWVNADPMNASALCILALLGIDTIRACVQSAGSLCTKLPVASRDDALAFVSDTGCLDVLDACLATGKPNQPSTGSKSCSGCGSTGCSKCNDDCSKCNDDCSKCNDNCAQCNDNCAECKQNSKDCNNNCKGSGGSAITTYDAAMMSRCSLKSRARSTDDDAEQPPIGTLLWLCAPAIFVLSRTRRRS